MVSDMAYSEALKRVLIGSERGVLIWDPRNSWNAEKSKEKPTLRVIAGIDNSIRSLSGKVLLIAFYRF